MALVTFEKSYDFLVDQTYNTGATDEEQHARILFGIKDALLNFTAAWSVLSSSDQVLAGASDYWTDWTKILWESGTAPHSWIVLESPGGGQLLIDCNYSSTRSDLLRVVWSPEGIFTGGTINVAPTALDQEIMVNIADWMGGATTVLQYQMHMIQSTDGENLLIFIYYNGVPVLNWIMLTVNDPVDNYTVNQIFFAAGNTSLTGWMGSVSRLFELELWSAKKDASGDATGLFKGTLTMPVTCPTTISTPLWAKDVIANANAFSGRWQLWPIGFASDVAGAVGRHGRIVDLWVPPANLGQGDTIEADSSNPTYELAVLGPLVVPWTGIAPPLIS